ncbi:TPA: hypothetical protein ENX78_10355 [Candidatus Poribacteria bacterium]|nr:hypothetical protein [Candidatus Poribacteria bacterium]
MKKEWIWTDHIKEQIIERELSIELVETILNEPDEIVEGNLGRQIYHKLIDDKLIRVITDGNVLITVYITDKVRKY